VSHDLALAAGGELDLDLARRVLGAEDRESDEVLRLRDALSATFVLTPEESGIGVVADQAPQADRTDDFRELLAVVLRLAENLGADVYDSQLDREIGPGDVDEVVRGFA